MEYECIKKDYPDNTQIAVWLLVNSMYGLDDISRKGKLFQRLIIYI